jgi:hypothetical protein
MKLLAAVRPTDRPSRGCLAKEPAMWMRLSNLIRGFLGLFISGIERQNPRALIEVEKENLRKQIARYNDNLAVQVSLDGASPDQHDAYRGAGTWYKTVGGIEALLAHGFHVRLSTTETPANTGHLDEVCSFHRALGIPEEDHLIRPLARRGFSQEGIELEAGSLTPEVTVTVDGVFWHPLSTDADMQISTQIFPLSLAVERIQQQIDDIATSGRASLKTFT